MTYDIYIDDDTITRFKPATASDPIKSVEDIEKIKNYFKEKDLKYYCIFVLGINTGLRISDILQFKKTYIDGNIITIKEQKTNKPRYIVLHKDLNDALKEFMSKDFYNNTDYIFKLHRSSVYRKFCYVFRKLNINIENIGTHTLRKTFGYHFYKKTKDIATLQKILNHSHPATTLRYIGIDKEKVIDSLKDFKL